MENPKAGAALITLANAFFISWWLLIPELKGTPGIGYYFFSYCLAILSLILFPKNLDRGLLTHAVVAANLLVVISPVLFIFWGICNAAFDGG